MDKKIEVLTELVDRAAQFNPIITPDDVCDLIQCANCPFYDGEDEVDECMAKMRKLCGNARKKAAQKKNE